MWTAHMAVDEANWRLFVVHFFVLRTHQRPAKNDVDDSMTACGRPSYTLPMQAGEECGG